MERVKSGVENFDRLVGGGIPERELVLVEGEPGCGKSNFGLEFLYRGAQRGDHGLYVSFQDTEPEVLRTTTFDWEFDQMVEDNRINITKFDPYRYEQIADMLRSTIKENDAKRVVLDPITDLDLYIDSRKDQRKNLLKVKKELSQMGCTTFMVAEREEATELEEEIADGIVQLELVREKGNVERHMYVKKLKGSDYHHGVHNYIIDNTGIKVR
ncbi:MAG: RAD55 family ATPase [Candidatus Nanohaloarchaea archaeon]